MHLDRDRSQGDFLVAGSFAPHILFDAAR
jgi:hypothetical protein